jgi:hypothetical protein
MAPTTTNPIRRRNEQVSPPAWVKPQLAALVKAAPDGPDWLHEIKFDGYRMHARLDAGDVQILTRRSNIWTEKYPAIVKAIAGLPTLEKSNTVTAGAEPNFFGIARLLNPPVDGNALFDYFFSSHALQCLPSSSA